MRATDWRSAKHRVVRAVSETSAADRVPSSDPRPLHDVQLAVPQVQQVGRRKRTARGEDIRLQADQVVRRSPQLAECVEQCLLAVVRHHW